MKTNNPTRLLRWSLIGACFGAAAIGAPHGAATFDLFTASEAAAWNAERPYAERGLTAPDANAVAAAPSCHSIPTTAPHAPSDPQINIIAPILGKPLSAPIDIKLQFISGSNVPIQPETFRVCYVGFLTMDITKRITDRVSVSAQGIQVTGAQLPRGHHHLVMLIADGQGHQGRSEATFDIQ